MSAEKEYTFAIDQGEGQEPKFIQVKEKDLTKNQFEILTARVRQVFNESPLAVKYVFINELHQALPETSVLKEKTKLILDKYGK